MKSICISLIHLNKLIKHIIEKEADEDFYVFQLQKVPQLLSFRVILFSWNMPGTKCNDKTKQTFNSQRIYLSVYCVQSR